jgi:hypothetical protein
MRTKYALFALAPVFLVSQLASAGVPSNRHSGARWEEAVEPQTSKIIIHNLKARPAEVSLGSEVVALSADGVAEVPAVKRGAAPLRSDAALLVLQARDGFDTTSLEIDKGAVDAPRAIPDKRAARARRPAWTRELAAGGESVRHGATGAATVRSDDPASRVQIAVEFLAPHTRVRIRQLDAMGNELTSLTASASRPVRWRVNLEPVDGESRVVLRTLRGEAQGTAAAVTPESTSRRSRLMPSNKVGGGLAKYVPPINWQGSADLYFEVDGGQASVCGDLYISRNYGSYSMINDYVCTDGNGDETMGPWYYANQVGDEDACAYVVWPNTTSTNTTCHIWDTTAPTVAITSSNGPPAPTTFSGTANDGSYGSGFSSAWGTANGGGSSGCYMYFYNLTTGWYYCPGSGYGAQFPCAPSCTLSGMPSRSVTWSAPSGSLPPGYAHVSGQCYEWGVSISDNGLLGQVGGDSITFCIP